MKQLLYLATRVISSKN